MDSLILVAAALGGAGVIWRYVWVPIGRGILNTRAFFKRLCKGLDSIEAIQKEFKPNSGSSMKDDLSNIKERLTYIENLTSAQMEDDPAAVFVCDSHASNSFCNRTYCRMLGVSRDELMGRSWEAFIPNGAIAKYTALWTSAFETNREISTDLFMNKADGTVLCVHLSLSPLNRQGDKLRRFLGKIRVNRDCSREKCLVNDSCPIIDKMAVRP